MSSKILARVAASLICTIGVVCLGAGCTLPQAGAEETVVTSGYPSRVYGEWERSADLVEEQLMRGSGTSSSGVSSGTASERPPRENHFRNTREGEPTAIHQFVNTVIVDDEFAKITLHAKTADELGDAGFTLWVENRYRPLTSVGRSNYLYITPILETWTVNGVPMEAKVEGKVYPNHPGKIYLYFDELSKIEELVNVKGKFEVYLISDWWNPVGVFEFSLE